MIPPGISKKEISTLSRALSERPIYAVYAVYTGAGQQFRTDRSTLRMVMVMVMAGNHSYGLWVLVNQKHLFLTT
jgi:hypothetical protein